MQFDQLLMTLANLLSSRDQTPGLAAGVAQRQFQNLLGQSERRVPVAGMSMADIQNNVPLRFETQRDYEPLIRGAVDNPNILPLLTQYLQMQAMVQPKYQFINQERGALQQVSIPPFGGQPTVKQVVDPMPEKQAKPNLPEGFAQITDPIQKAELFNKTYGLNLPPSAFEVRPTAGQDLSVKKALADSKRTLSKAQKVIRDFEANPTLVQNYQKIVNDPEFSKAVSGGDVDLASAILARLVGDTTPQRVLTKRYFDYIKAINEEEGELAYLKELGVNTKPLIRQQKKETKQENLKDLRGLF